MSRLITSQRRIAAIVLPELACELARPLLRGDAPHPGSSRGDGPFAVIVAGEESERHEPIEKTAVLDAVDRQAHRYGARPGQKAAQATAYAGALEVVRITRARVLEALGAVAEVALAYGTTAALELEVRPHALHGHGAELRYPLGMAAGPLDTVWLDVSGCARLVGGDDHLVAELRERVEALGHRARVALADGPRIAQSLGRWAANPADLVVAPGGSAAAIQRLPVAALPIRAELCTWLGKLGVLRIEDLARLDPARVSHRLGPVARDLSELIAGRDVVPLVSHRPPRRIVESAAFEQEVSAVEPLLFVLRGLTARAIARLGARGQAAGRVSLELAFDRSVITLHNRTRPPAERLPFAQELVVPLPVPLSRQEELLRTLGARLERLELPAPLLAVTLTLDELTEQSHHQLELAPAGARGKRSADPGALPSLLAELSAQLGADRLGVLQVVDSLRPEARSRLAPVGSSSAPVAKVIGRDEPTRLLPQPILLSPTALEPGAMVLVDKNAFVVERLRYTERLEQIEWWSGAPLQRDYARASLVTRATGSTSSDALPVAGDALIYLDRASGQSFLHGWFE
jgi:protein ImuB